jgi:hypothetical protein
MANFGLGHDDQLEMLEDESDLMEEAKIYKNP